MIPHLDIYQAANLLVKQHGAEAGGTAHDGEG